MRTKVDKVRETALKILYDINEKGAYSNISLNKYLNGQELKVLTGRLSLTLCTVR